ncbi:hypothetical protein [Sedimenticola thiotaurini]|nr:hypothetical protein [Sedimenticola thiotaurini]
MLKLIRPAFAALFFVLLTGCVPTVTQKPTLAKPNSTQPATPVVNNDKDPLYQPLKNVDLSQYKRAGDGLLLVGRKGEYDLLLTEPGRPYKVSKSRFEGIKKFNNDQFMNYSGYMLRWVNNKNEPAPYIGRLTSFADDGRKAVYKGAFVATHYKAKAFGSTPTGPKAFLEGIETQFDASGRIVEMDYKIHRYTSKWLGPKNNRKIVYYTFPERTTREVELTPATKEQAAVATRATGLPDFQFVLPHPRQLAEKMSSLDRALFTRAYSLVDLFEQKKINTDHLLLQPFAPTKGEYREIRRFQWELLAPEHAMVHKGQSAFIYSPMTRHTYLLPHPGDSYKNRSPILTLPSLQDIVINGQLAVNQQCLGKTDGMVVLSGQCDPEAPGFPLTVLTQLSADQFIINIWSDIDRRSTYLLTGSKFPKEAHYRWSVDAFMVDESVAPDTTLAVLATGEDSFSDKLVAFASRGQDQQACDRMSTAVSHAEQALRFDPRIDRRLASYQKQLRFWEDTNLAIYELKRNPSKTPVTDFRRAVWNDLVSMKRDINQRLATLKRHRDVNNSACQPDSQRMDELVSALTDFERNLSASMKQLDETYYAQAEALKNDLFSLVARQEEAQNNAAMALFLSRLQASLNADLNARQAQSNSIMRSMIASRKAVDAQIAEVKARNAAYFANKKPVVAAPQNNIVRPVAMPLQPLDTTAGSKVYLNGKKPTRLSTQQAIAQAQAKTKRLVEQRKAGSERLTPDYNQTTTQNRLAQQAKATDTKAKAQPKTNRYVGSGRDYPFTGKSGQYYNYEMALELAQTNLENQASKFCGSSMKTEIQWARQPVCKESASEKEQYKCSIDAKVNCYENFCDKQFCGTGH